MIVWTHAISGVLHACVLYFCIFHLFNAIERVSHGKALQKYAHYYHHYHYYRLLVA